jgi:hypothetical protein
MHPTSMGLDRRPCFLLHVVVERTNARAANIEDIKIASDTLSPGSGEDAQQKINNTKTKGTCTTKVKHHNMSAPAKREIPVPLSPAQSAEGTSQS